MRLRYFFVLASFLGQMISSHSWGETLRPLTSFVIQDAWYQHTGYIFEWTGYMRPNSRGTALLGAYWDNKEG